MTRSGSSRVIKFRAWDELLGKMIDWEDLITDEVNLEVLFRKDFSIRKMQFIGLRDKNNLEVYEGDILKHPVGIIATVKYVPEHAAFLAYYSMEGSSKYDYLEGDGRMKNCEVIGNIYEHPHLLEGS